jgi:glycosyltransferase involved in cell wall biosynthesis
MDYQPTPELPDLPWPRGSGGVVATLDGVGLVQARPPKVVAVVPAFNEQRSIGSVVIQAQKYADTVVVVDDGSADATAEIASDAGAVVIRHSENRGKGVALNTGFRAAHGIGAEVVVTLDADGQHVVEELPLVARPIIAGEADIVVGSRYLEQRSDVPFLRIWGHQVFNFITNQSSGISVTDSQSGFRAFSSRAIASIAFSSSGFSVESEMQFLARDKQLRMLEVPIVIRYHDEKPKRNVLLHGWLVLNGLLRLIGQHRPLMFFSIPGLLVFLTGLFLGVWVVEIYQQAGTLAVGYALITVLLSVVGLLALFTGIMLHSVRGLLLHLEAPHEPIEVVDVRPGANGRS